MAKDNLKERIEELKSQGKTVWSISRLNTLDNCELEYFMNYVQGLKGEQNIYGLLGGDYHDTLEEITLGSKGEKDLVKTYNNGLLKCNLLGLKFPADYIEKAWKTDMLHFSNNFVKLEYDKIDTEVGLIFIVNDHYLQGFIDIVAHNEDDSVDIIDWKSSSEFKDIKLLSAGRQLILYKIAYEQQIQKKVRRVGWYMMKYVDIYYDGKKKRCARRNIVKDLKGLITTQLKKLQYLPFMIDMLVSESLSKNTLDNMPSQVKDRFIIEPCMIWYDFTDGLQCECVQYIEDKIKIALTKNKDDINDWEHPDLNDDKKMFYCKGLCGHKEHCYAYQDFMEC